MQNILGCYSLPKRTLDTLDVYNDFDCLNSLLLLLLSNRDENICIGNFCWKSLVHLFFIFYYKNWEIWNLRKIEFAQFSYYFRVDMVKQQKLRFPNAQNLLFLSTVGGLIVKFVCNSIFSNLCLFLDTAFLKVIGCIA